MLAVAQKLPRPLRDAIQAIARQPLVRFVLALANRISADDVPGLSAEMAYRFLFAMFPFLIFVAALVGFVGARIGSDDLFSVVMEQISRLAPPEVAAVLSDWVSGVVHTQSPSLLTLGVAGALYGAAGGVGTLIKGLNRAHEAEETRSFFKVQGMGLMTTLALALFMVGGVVIFTLGESLRDWLVARFGLGDTFKMLWSLLTGPGLVVVLFIILVGLYRALPNTTITVRQAMWGALFGTVAWVVLTLGFSFYLEHFGSYERTFGSLGTAVMLMVWMYFVAMILLIGGEINALVAGSSVQETAAYDADAGMEHLLEELERESA
jgi:membrane protein